MYLINRYSMGALPGKGDKQSPAAWGGGVRPTSLHARSIRPLRGLQLPITHQLNVNADTFPKVSFAASSISDAVTAAIFLYISDGGSTSP